MVDVSFFALQPLQKKLQSKRKKAICCWSIIMQHVHMARWCRKKKHTYSQSSAIQMLAKQKGKGELCVKCSAGSWWRLLQVPLISQIEVIAKVVFSLLFVFVMLFVFPMGNFAKTWLQSPCVSPGGSKLYRYYFWLILWLQYESWFLRENNFLLFIFSEKKYNNSLDIFTAGSLWICWLEHLCVHHKASHIVLYVHIFSINIKMQLLVVQMEIT